MRSLTFSCFFLALILAVFPGSSQTINIKTLGAKGDGVTDDSQAFLKLNQWIAANRKGVITIPKGVYLVGTQKRSANPATAGWTTETVIDVNGASNLTINAEGATIRYRKGLKYGSFNPTTGAVYKTTGAFYNRSYIASLGYCIMIERSNGVTVNGLDLDGNAGQMVLGGSWGDKGTQIPHYGIYILNSDRVTLSNVKTHHFCLDGVAVDNPSDQKLATPARSIVLDHLSSTFNGRQGLSWVGGSGLTVRNSVFSNTGKGSISSAPGAGVDIEPERSNYCINGSFVNCRFENNTGSGFVTDVAERSMNHSFDNCTFASNHSFVVWPNGGNLKFTNCTINGCLLPGSKTGLPVLFDHCVFNDMDPAASKLPSGYLIDGGGGQFNYIIRNSVFNLNYLKLCWIQANTTNKQAYAQFVGNRVYIKHKKTLTQLDYVGLFKQAVLSGNMFQCNVPKSGKGGYYFVMENVTQSNNTVESTTQSLRLN